MLTPSMPGHTIIHYLFYISSKYGIFFLLLQHTVIISCHYMLYNRDVKPRGVACDQSTCLIGYRTGPVSWIWFPPPAPYAGSVPVIFVLGDLRLCHLVQLVWGRYHMQRKSWTGQRGHCRWLSPRRAKVGSGPSMLGTHRATLPHVTSGT